MKTQVTLTLTKKQMKGLKFLYDEANKAKAQSKPGSIILQPHSEAEGLRAYMLFGAFIPNEPSEKILKILKELE